MRFRRMLLTIKDDGTIKKQNENDAIDADWPDWAHDQYMDELKTMIDVLYNHPSVVVWTTFNERWGQHRSMEIGTWVKNTNYHCWQQFMRTKILHMTYRFIIFVRKKVPVVWRQN
jgi:beta-galactosidase/beta-glucuronidase